MLRGFVVWTPMVEGDDKPAADAQKERLDKDPRLLGTWDPDRTLGRLLAPVLALSGRFAWDVYLVYGADAEWSGDAPPVPAVWMHQLDAEPPSRRLDEAALAREVELLLERR